jgi:hypothetical protein
MKRYELLVRVASGISVRTIVYASSSYEAKMLGEAQYGQGNVMDYTELNDLSAGSAYVSLNT